MPHIVLILRFISNHFPPEIPLRSDMSENLCYIVFFSILHLSGQISTP